MRTKHWYEFEYHTGSIHDFAQVAHGHRCRKTERRIQTLPVDFYFLRRRVITTDVRAKRGNSPQVRWRLTTGCEVPWWTQLNDEGHTVLGIGRLHVYLCCP